MSEVLTVDYELSGAAELFTKSLKDIGFVVLSNSPISNNLVSSVYSNWKPFFNSEEKINYHYQKINPPSEIRQAGYFPFGSESAKGSNTRDLKEFYHVYPDSQLPERIKISTWELYRGLSELAGELLGWIQKYSPEKVRKGFSEPLGQMIRGSKNTLLRVIHYPPMNGAEIEGEVRAAAHEDINLITLLPSATVSGLQVLDQYGIWHNVKTDQNSIVVNAGDMLQMCSRGYFPSTSHRVINPEGIDKTMSRYSMPLFLHPRDEVRLSEEYTSREYLDVRLSELV